MVEKNIQIYLKKIIENLQEIDEFKNVEEKLSRNNVSITFTNKQQTIATKEKPHIAPIGL